MLKGSLIYWAHIDLIKKNKNKVFCMGSQPEILNIQSLHEVCYEREDNNPVRDKETEVESACDEKKSKELKKK